MFRNYYDLDDVRLDLPIGEKTYTIPPITAAAGARLETDDNIPDEEFVQLTLGAALEQLRADGIRPEAIVRAALTSLANHRDGRDVAVMMWETNALPERLAAYMAARLTDSPASTPSPSSATAGKTRSPGGTRATTSRPATPPRRKPAKKSPSPGRKSSAASTS
jgi:hypothetical protein